MTKFSAVYEALHSATGQKVAVKFIFRYEGRTAAIEREIAIICRLHHQNIIEHIDHFVYKEFTVLVTPFYYGGNLFNMIDREHHKGIDPNSALSITRQCLSALNYLHSQNILHLDIKPENFLVENPNVQNPVIVLADFGLSREISHPGSYRGGTRGYMSPEDIYDWPVFLSAHILALEYPFINF